MKYTKTTPCDNCPFRREGFVCLTRERVKEITSADGEFPCHKTTKHDDDGEYVRTGKEVACAGFLIFREKTSGPNQMMRIAERLGVYNAQPFIESKADVFASLQEMLKAHAKPKRRSSCRTHPSE